MSIRRFFWLPWILLLAARPVIVAGEPTLPAQAGVQYSQPQQPTGELVVSDIIRMVRAGVSEDVVISRIKLNRRPFKLTAEEIVELKTELVSDRVIKVMMDPTVDATVPVVDSAAPRSSAVLPAAVLTQAPAATQSSSQADLLFWRERYDSAKSKKRSGAILGVTAFGLNGLGLYLYFTMDKNVTVFDPFTRSSVSVRLRDDGKRWGSVASHGAALVFHIWGWSRVNSGAKEMRRLEAEGRSKGYITLGPSPKGNGLALAYTF